MNDETPGFLSSRNFVMALIAVWLARSGGSAVVTQKDLDDVAFSRVTEDWDGEKLTVRLERLRERAS